MATHSSILAWRIPVDRWAWQATVHGITKSQTQLKWLSTLSCYREGIWGFKVMNNINCPREEESRILVLVARLFNKVPKLWNARLKWPISALDLYKPRWGKRLFLLLCLNRESSAAPQIAASGANSRWPGTVSSPLTTEGVRVSVEVTQWWVTSEHPACRELETCLSWL